MRILRTIMGKVDNTQEQGDNVSREMKTITNNQKETLQMKSTVTELKKDCDGLINILSIVKEGIRDVKDIP